MSKTETIQAGERTQSPQEIAIAVLERSGFEFTNWIGSDEDDREAMMVKHVPRKGMRYYAQVDDFGMVNGEPLESFIKGHKAQGK